MKNKLKTIAYSILIFISYNATAADGHFTGDVKFGEKSQNTLKIQRFNESSTPKKYNSGITISGKSKQLTFQEKLASASDK